MAASSGGEGCFDTLTDAQPSTNLISTFRRLYSSVLIVSLLLQVTLEPS